MPATETILVCPRCGGTKHRFIQAILYAEFTTNLFHCLGCDARFEQRGARSNGSRQGTRRKAKAVAA